MTYIHTNYLSLPINHVDDFIDGEIVDDIYINDDGVPVELFYALVYAPACPLEREEEF